MRRADNGEALSFVWRVVSFHAIEQRFDKRQRNDREWNDKAKMQVGKALCETCLTLSTEVLGGKGWSDERHKTKKPKQNA